jgi:hypothetical protein
VLQGAIDGNRSRILRPVKYLRSRGTEPKVVWLLEELELVRNSATHGAEAELVLSINAAGELEAAVPLLPSERETEATSVETVEERPSTSERST